VRLSEEARSDQRGAIPFVFLALKSSAISRLRKKDKNFPKLVPLFGPGQHGL
jgi:hypothetical protein